MLSHLGFRIAIDITLRQGARDRTPSKGVCHVCGNRRERVYIRGNGETYCQECIEVELAYAPAHEDQARPDKDPTETMYEKLREKSLYDDFDPRVWRNVP